MLPPEASRLILELEGDCSGARAEYRDARAVLAAGRPGKIVLVRRPVLIVDRHPIAPVAIVRYSELGRLAAAIVAGDPSDRMARRLERYRSVLSGQSEDRPPAASIEDDDLVF